MLKPEVHSEKRCWGTDLVPPEPRTPARLHAQEGYCERENVIAGVGAEMGFN